MKLWVEIPTKATVFSAVYKYNATVRVKRPVLLRDPVIKLATDLFEQVFKNDPYASLKELEISFVTLEIGDRMDSWIVEDPIKVKKLERDDAKSPAEGGFSVDYRGTWKYPEYD